MQESSKSKSKSASSSEEPEVVPDESSESAKEQSSEEEKDKEEPWSQMAKNIKQRTSNKAGAADVLHSYLKGSKTLFKNPVSVELCHF